METPDAEFWQLVEIHNDPHQGLLEGLAQDAEDRAAEAHALMDAAEQPGCSPQERHELLRDTCALLLHARTYPPAIVRAVVRLRLLLPSEGE